MALVRAFQLFLLQVWLVGCAAVAFYDEPEVGVTNIRLIVLDDTYEMKRICEHKDANACMEHGDPCTIWAVNDSWELYIEHEVAHCLGVLEHN